MRADVAANAPRALPWVLPGAEATVAEPLRVERCLSLRCFFFAEAVPDSWAAEAAPAPAAEARLRRDLDAVEAEAVAVPDLRLVVRLDCGMVQPYTGRNVCKGAL